MVAAESSETKVKYRFARKLSPVETGLTCVLHAVPHDTVSALTVAGLGKTIDDQLSPKK